MNIYSLFYIVVAFLFTGCSIKEKTGTPMNLKDMKNIKITTREDNVSIKRDNKDFFKIYLSKDNRIEYICVNANKACNYKGDSSDIVFMYRKSFYPNFSINKRGIQCGVGSMAGLYVFVPNFTVENHNKKNKLMCNNKFTMIDSTQTFERIIIGTFTFGTSLLTGGTMHTVKFDEESFKKAIVDANLDSYKSKFFKMNINSFNSGIDVLYLDSKDMKKNLIDFIDKLVKSKYSRDALLIVDKRTKQILSFIQFKQYPSKDIIRNISLQISKVFDEIKVDNKKLLITEKDIINWIPYEVEKPQIPQVPTLVKDEFETKKEFIKRVKTAVEKRENEIRRLQKEYNLEILKRNAYISTLEKLYIEYLKNVNIENIKLKKELNENIDLFTEVLFLENLNGLNEKDFKYDAEKRRLFFNLYSENKNLSINVFSKIPAIIAKRIKYEKSFYIKPVLKFKKNYMYLKDFYIVDIKTKNSFKVISTDMHFLPVKHKVVIKSKKNKISNDIKNKIFVSYKQESERITKSDKELWYVEMVDSINAKVPTWFTNTNNLDVSVSFGSASTYEEAKIKALNDLAMAKEVRISSIMKAKTEFDNRVSSYSNLDKTILSKSDITFKNSEYKILKQEKVDGIWYISLKYIGK